MHHRPLTQVWGRVWGLQVCCVVRLLDSPGHAVENASVPLLSPAPLALGQGSWQSEREWLLFVAGGCIQLGSLAGALMFYALVNYSRLFQR